MNTPAGSSFDSLALLSGSDVSGTMPALRAHALAAVDALHLVAVTTLGLLLVSGAWISLSWVMR